MSALIGTADQSHGWPKLVQILFSIGDIIDNPNIIKDIDDFHSMVSKADL